MAESKYESEEISQEGGRPKLKYLDFVHVAAMQAVVCLASLYDFARENSGPLKPGVQTVEGTVKTVIGPVYDKFHDVPLELLKFVDRKVADSVRELQRHVPSPVKSASAQAYTAAQKAPQVARCVAGEVQRSGMVATAAGMVRACCKRFEPAASQLYKKYEPVAEKYAVAAWRSLNRLPLFPQVAQIGIPWAAYWSEKYNRAVGCAAERGYAVAQCMPLVPTERIAKVFGDGSPESPSGSSKPAPPVAAAAAECG
ncbi:stress-related protein [Phoenix dactylifera]|uniref:Stress-related protein n=1 Tax=Phoenix dactylifera TaxID=42345 RepID=A0A8B7C1V4_PHODC|nr:stress-related protein [Phoenix dactylifera]